MNKVIQADEARWDETRQVWVFEKGVQRLLSSAPGVAVVDSLRRTEVREYPSDLTPKELALQQSTQWMNYVSLPQLNRLQARFPNVTEYVRVKHTRLTTVLINMILLGLGIPFFLNRERPPVLVAGGKCLLASGACFATTFMCQAVEWTQVAVNPALPAWIPVVVFAPLAVLLMDGVKT